ncbi:unnamed protein product [Arctogadus glacialis]
MATGELREERKHEQEHGSSAHRCRLQTPQNVRRYPSTWQPKRPADVCVCDIRSLSCGRSRERTADDPLEEVGSGASENGDRETLSY